MRKRLIKGSKEAKLFMAKIRAKKGPAKKAAKKIGSVAESKKLKKELKAKKVRLVHGYETVKRKRKLSGIHKDTKSHNVKISVMSGLNKDNLEAIKDRTKFDETLYMFLDDLKFQLKNKYLSSQQKNDIKKHIVKAKKQQADNRKILNLLKKSI